MCAALVVMTPDALQTLKATSGRAAAAAPTSSANGQPLDTPYRFRWDRCGRKGQKCRVTARGKMNSCRVEFDDGFVMVTSRNAIARWKER